MASAVADVVVQFTVYTQIHCLEEALPLNLDGKKRKHTARINLSYRDADAGTPLAWTSFVSCFAAGTGTRLCVPGQLKPAPSEKRRAVAAGAADAVLTLFSGLKSQGQ